MTHQPTDREQTIPASWQPKPGTDAARVRDGLYRSFGKPENMDWSAIPDPSYMGDGERDVMQEEFAIVGPSRTPRILDTHAMISPVSYEAGYVVARYHHPGSGQQPYLAEVFKDTRGTGRADWVLFFNSEGSCRGLQAPYSGRMDTAENMQKARELVQEFGPR